MSGTCAMVVPWHVSGFGYADVRGYQTLFLRSRVWGTRLDSIRLQQFHIRYIIINITCNFSNKHDAILLHATCCIVYGGLKVFNSYICDGF